MSRKFGLYAALIAAAVIAILILGSRAIHVSAAARTDVPAVSRHYVSYKIQPGDSLWSLAEERCFGICSEQEYIDEVKKLNCLTSDTIISGTRIYLIRYDR